MHTWNEADNSQDVHPEMMTGQEDSPRRASFGSSSGHRSLDGHSLSSSLASSEDYPGIHTPLGSDDATGYSIANPSHTLQHINPTDDSEQVRPDRVDHSFLDRLEDINFRPASPTYSEFIHYDPHASQRTSPEPTEMMNPDSNLATSSSEPTSPTSSISTTMAPATIVPASSQRSRAPLSKASSIIEPKVTKNGVEKRVGRRKGKLRPEQRASAAQIRKLGACIRCRCLKKTCSEGAVCHNCIASHNRLWTVPCTRLDIKQMDYFLKGWNLDTARHITLAVSIDNIVSFGNEEMRIWVGHDFGVVMPLMVREVTVRDNTAFDIEWADFGTDPTFYKEEKIHTSHLAIGRDDSWRKVIDDYVSKHITLPGFFDTFVDVHFEGFKFLPEMLKIAKEYAMYSEDETVLAALKMLVAYNLTFKVIVGSHRHNDPEVLTEGLITDENSRLKDKIIAPAFINFQIKNAMAMIWRELFREVLDDMSKFIRGTYNGDHLTKWPTILFGSFIILSMMEEMQFDTCKRAASPGEAQSFCLEMESTPAAVFTGMFRAISQKLPSFMDWKPHQPPESMQPDAHTWSLINKVAVLVQKHGKLSRKI